MESEKRQITVKKTAQYYVLGEITKAQTIWIVLHGYGYLAQYFIQKFEAIINENTCVIAPEGLSKFYVNGLDGRVGASWMTKENREAEIDDYVFYLNALYEEIIKVRKNKPFKLNVVGFSQGGATASRWIAHSNIQPVNFMLWACVFPEDMNLEFFKKHQTNTYFLYGDKDVYLTEDRVTEQIEVFKKSGIKYTVIPFLGKHDIPEDVLLEQVKRFEW